MFPTKFRDILRTWESSPQVVSDTRSEVNTAARATGPMTPVNTSLPAMQMYSQRAATATFKSARDRFASLKSGGNTSISAAAATLKGFSKGSVDTPTSFNHPNLEEYNKKFDDARKEWTAGVNLTPAQQDREAETLYDLFPFYRTREDTVKRRVKAKAGKIRRKIGTHVKRELKTLAAERRREAGKKGADYFDKIVDIEDDGMRSARSDKQDLWPTPLIGETTTNDIITSPAADDVPSIITPSLIKPDSQAFPPILVSITADNVEPSLPSFKWKFENGGESIFVFDPRTIVVDEHGTGTIKTLKRKATSDLETPQKRIRVIFEERPVHHTPTSTNPPEMVASLKTVSVPDDAPAALNTGLSLLSIDNSTDALAIPGRRNNRALKPLATNELSDLRRSARMTKKNIHLRVGRDQIGPHRSEY